MNDGLLAPFSPDDVKKLLSALVISRRRDQTAYVQFFTNIFGADAVKKLLMKFWKP
jgi:tRNA isopentenyl-2-thiomethyl-A-37 hydroxylase MiaE